jgi:diketogulonate reductase-like aldo/keto reductase
MERRVMGATGVAVPIIGQGTWRMEEDDRDECIAALRVGMDAGMTHIDTAELYGDGYVEAAIVAEAIRGRRDEVFLVSKVLPHNASYDGTLAACERSLRRLDTDWIDLYLLHWRGMHPLAGTLDAFERLVEEGKIGYYGVSNFDVGDLEEAIGYVGPERLLCDQVLYHLEERAIEGTVIPACEDDDVAVVAYSPFGHDHFPTGHTRRGRVLAEIARRHGVSARAVALTFLVRRRSVFAIPKAARPAHARANAAAGDLRLSRVELAEIDEAFAKGPQPATLPML